MAQETKLPVVFCGTSDGYYKMLEDLYFNTQEWNPVKKHNILFEYSTHVDNVEMGENNFATQYIFTVGPYSIVFWCSNMTNFCYQKAENFLHKTYPDSLKKHDNASCMSYVVSYVAELLSKKTIKTTPVAFIDCGHKYIIPYLLNRLNNRCQFAKLGYDNIQRQSFIRSYSKSDCITAVQVNEVLLNKHKIILWNISGSGGSLEMANEILQDIIKEKKYQNTVHYDIDVFDCMILPKLITN
jgi:hypothetical protein